MSTYAELQDQIKELQKQAEEARKQEVRGVIDEIKGKIRLYGITAKDLGFSESENKEEKGANEAKNPIPSKYRSPDGTKEWNGRGPKPKWFKEAIDSGRSEDDLLINRVN